MRLNQVMLLGLVYSIQEFNYSNHQILDYYLFITHIPYIPLFQDLLSLPLPYKTYYHLVTDPMTTQFNQQEFISFCGKGNIEQAKRKLQKDNVDIHCKERDTLNTAAHLAVMNDHLEVLRFLRESGFIFAVTGDELSNAQGNTPLHIASQKPNFETMLFLLINNHPTVCKNKKNLKPGDSNMEARIFLNSVVPEEKAFNSLKPHHKTKLADIFKDIDFDDMKIIDHHKAVRFNRYVEETLTESAAEKDAKDFMKWTAICNKSTVNLDEWLFAFSKLYVCEEAAFDKFLEDYDKAVASQGKLKEINI